MGLGAVGFQPLRRGDFGLVAAWLADPVVARWWNHDSGPDGVERDFGPSVDGRDPTEIFLATIAGAPFGLIQRYLISSSPEHQAELTTVCHIPPFALSIDYLIGNPDRRGRGLGGSMIAEFVRVSWPLYPETNAVVVPIPVGNRASWRSLERAGFRRVGTGELTPDNPIDPPDHHVYRVDRDPPAAFGESAGDRDADLR